ncbi:MAG: hypothetical protein IPG96_17335 [Proteobacteria bacterium]|nr:hypothetical protein [Pseudomonadota bacterium]
MKRDPRGGRVRRWPCLLRLAGCALLASVSCGGEAEQQGLCDLRARGCQQGIYRELVALRGGGAVPSLPRVRLITRAELEALARAAEGDGAGAGDEPRCVEQAFSRGLQQLGLLAPATPVGAAAAETFTEGVAAFYTSADDTVTIVDELSEDPAVDLGTLAHELTHALQQRERLSARLDGWQARGSDAELAQLALSEGEATFCGLAVALARSGRAVSELNWEAAFDLLDQLALEEVREAASALVAARFTLPYPLGGRYFSRRFLEQARPDLPAIYEAWPRSTIGLLAPDDAGAPVEPLPLACGPPAAPAGSLVADDDRMGAVGAYALGAKVLALSDPRTLARQWRDDRMLQYVGPGQVAAVSWRLRLALPADAQTLFEQATGQATARDWQVLRLSAEEVALLGAWPAPAPAAVCAPPDEGPLFGPTEYAAAEVACAALGPTAAAARNTSLHPLRLPLRAGRVEPPPLFRRWIGATLR